MTLTLSLGSEVWVQDLQVVDTDGEDYIENPVLEEAIPE